MLGKERCGDFKLDLNSQWFVSELGSTIFVARKNFPQSNFGVCAIPISVSFSSSSLNSLQLGSSSGIVLRSYFLNDAGITAKCRPILCCLLLVAPCSPITCAMRISSCGGPVFDMHLGRCWENTTVKQGFRQGNPLELCDSINPLELC